MFTGEQNVNAILVDDEFVSKLINEDVEVFTQFLSNLKILFLEKFTLGQLDNVMLGE